LLIWTILGSVYDIYSQYIPWVSKHVLKFYSAKKSRLGLLRIRRWASGVTLLWWKKHIHIHKNLPPNLPQCQPSLEKRPCINVRAIVVLNLSLETKSISSRYVSSFHVPVIPLWVEHQSYVSCLRWHYAPANFYDWTIIPLVLKDFQFLHRNLLKYCIKIPAKFKFKIKVLWDPCPLNQCFI
jgi:hypothetical protein